MKESVVSEKKAGSTSAQRGKEAASLTKDGLGVADQPLMNIVQRAGCRDCGPSVQSLAGGMMQIPTVQRRTAAMSLQRTRGNRVVQRMAMQAKREPNRTGMPDRLKAGIESLSGIDVSDIRVHANSDKPARLNALAYAQGNQIYLGPGQERYLPHEAWHVVQQKQGRVQPTMQIGDAVAVNYDVELEKEAERIGVRTVSADNAIINVQLSRNSIELAHTKQETILNQKRTRTLNDLISMKSTSKRSSTPIESNNSGEAEVIQCKSNIVQLVWDPDKCPNGGPQNFNPVQAVNLADFNQSVFVNISGGGTTKQAYTYVQLNGWTICVVGHIHLNHGAFGGPGNCFIPGWMYWQTQTSNANAQIINGLGVGGVFPGNNRYPH
jgi:hypothetical protein